MTQEELIRIAQETEATFPNEFCIGDIVLNKR